MDNTIESIRDSFDREIRIFERYLNDIHKSIAQLNKQAKDLENYIDDGGSLDIPSRPLENSTAMTIGIVDTPEMREVASFALNNRLEELKSYIEISLTMAFSHFMAIFDARYMDLISLFYERNPKLLKDITLERKLMNFAYKPFKTQILSIQNNLKIDFYKLIGEQRVADLIEIRATRNLVVHNSGIINKLYLDVVKDSSFAEGAKRPLTVEYFEQSTELMQLFFYTLTQEIISGERSASTALLRNYAQQENAAHEVHPPLRRLIHSNSQNQCPSSFTRHISGLLSDPDFSASSRQSVHRLPF